MSNIKFNYCIVEKKGWLYVKVSYVINGKRQQKWLSLKLKVGANKQERESRAAEVVKNFINALELPKSYNDLLFTEAIIQWLDKQEKRKGKRADTTLIHYRDDTNNHIIPYFEKNYPNLRLIDIKKSIIQEYIDEMSEHGNLKTGKGLAEKSIKNHIDVMRGPINEAIDDGLEIKTPFNRLDYKKDSEKGIIKRDTDDLPTTDEIANFLNYVKEKNYVYFTIILMAALYGLRRSEVLGLKWKNIDFTNQTFKIISSVKKGRHEILYKDELKTKSSYREYPLLPSIGECLLKIKNDNEILNKVYADRIDKSQDWSVYVFQSFHYSGAGKPFHPDTITSKVREYKNQLGITKQLTPHTLRHFCVTQLKKERMDPKFVSDFVGHQSTLITNKTYTHTDLETKTMLANTLEEALFNNPTEDD